jgi:hypothetical protein
MHTWDGVVVFWIALWLVMGAWTGYQIWQLTDLSVSTQDAGHALESAGSALQAMADTPLIGEATGQIGDRVVETATSIVSGGASAGASIRALSVLIGLTVCLAPTGPVLFFYLPGRVRRSHEVSEITAAMQDGGPTKALEAHLALRAVSNLRFSELMDLTDDPWADLSTGRHSALARAELARLGLGPIHSSSART